jgi:hypothetical protein
MDQFVTELVFDYACTTKNIHILFKKYKAVWLKKHTVISKREELTVHEIYGVLHREDGPAMYSRDDLQIWMTDGKYDNKNGPAVIWKEARKIHYEYDEDGLRLLADGFRHRFGDYKEYWVNPLCPAVEYIGRADWWIDGVRIW